MFYYLRPERIDTTYHYDDCEKMLNVKCWDTKKKKKKVNKMQC